MFQDSGSFLKFAMPGFQGACSWNIYPFKKAFMKDTTFGGILFDIASRGHPLTYFFQDFSASKQFLWMAYFWSPQGRGHNPAKKLDPKFINTPHSTVLAHQGMADTILMILDTTQIWIQVVNLRLGAETKYLYFFRSQTFDCCSQYFKVFQWWDGMGYTLGMIGF